ncbi:MAG: aldehyde dehydrogenase family protein [Acidovorax sp.]|jgi:coniferyl-aldehyde dehydrogenase|nr:aldehyde dehydrogenase family protein [Acidovorax sp.]
MTSPALQQAFELQYQASRQQVAVPAMLRKERLLRVQRMLDEHGAVLTAAVQADFGVRSVRLTEFADLLVLRTQLKQALRKLERWMRPRHVWTPLQLWPARARIERQPLGVVGIIAPWNYPLQMALGPAIAALAAGNRVMLKPSELAPHTAAQLAAVVAQFFAPEEFCVVQGDSYVSTQFAGLPFDHLVFTGSTAVGRRVAQAAAVHLTPTTLELGGKSPCILGTDCDMQQAALRVAHGKLLNAGQTCIAPDYLLLPRGQELAFEQAYRQAVARLYPRVVGNPDYAAIINQRHLLRLRQLLQQAQAQGAQVQVLDPAAGKSGEASTGWGDASQRQMPPALVWNVQPDMALMQEEIFGPILPVVPYDRLDDAIAAINAGPRPLALYWFGKDEKARDAVLRGTVSGGVTVNDTLLHVAHENLPFGGVGDSGWGAYHGEHGFLRFSHQKSVCLQGRWSAMQWLYPPYGARFDQILALLKRWG